MGIQSRKYIGWKAEGLSLKSIRKLDIKRIDVDGYALAIKMGRSGGGGKSVGKIVNAMATHLKKIAHSGGFVISVIFDGSMRPDCKTATFSRKKQSKMNDINRRYVRLRALELNASVGENLRNGGATGVDNADKEALQKYNDAFKSFENDFQSRVILPPNFPDLLSERLMVIGACNENENGGYVVEDVKKALFQADSLIARRFLENESDIIYGEDSDYWALIGHSCVMMWDVIKMKSEQEQTNQKKNKQQDEEGEGLTDATRFSVVLTGACNNKMREIKNSMNTILDKKNKMA